LVTESLDLVGEVGVEGGKREEVEAMSCSKMVFSLEAALARLSRALSMEWRRPG
jgi:hypothetical protein